MNDVEAEFHQSDAEPATRAVALSHVSVEVGHLYPEDLQHPDRLPAMFAQAAVWARTCAESVRLPGRRARVSTCFLVDDYFGDLPGPADLIPDLLSAAAGAGLRIDYLAREAACADATGPAGPVSPARLVTAQLVDEPAPGSLGARPPAAQSGWLCNGVRSGGSGPAEAFDLVPAWTPPRQHAARRHSVVIDVQLWDDDGDERTWSCPMLAATWQLLRLGLLRDAGRPLAQPQQAPSTWPDRWSQLPAVSRLEPRADPFCAYRTMSVLSARFLPVEAAVRTILGQVQQDPAVIAEITTRARAESFPLPVEVVDRLGYALVGGSEADPL